MILSAATLRRLKPVEPFVERGIIRGRSFGLSVASYDVRIAQSFSLLPGEFKLASTLEKFNIPNHVAATVADKSSYARQGLSVFNTFIDPGFKGFLTLELKNLGGISLKFEKGDPVAQVLFYLTDAPTDGYAGKFQNQEAGPQKARYEIPLSQGKFAIIDFEDFEKVSGVKWHTHSGKRSFYAARNTPRVNGKKTLILMHHIIIGCPDDLEVNHINGNGLDNRRVNLQICTHQQNVSAFQRKRKNTSSKYRGVSWHKQNERWHARIKHNYKIFNIGCFDNEEAAARAFDAKAVELRGEYAALNFPQDKT